MTRRICTDYSLEVKLPPFYEWTLLEQMKPITHPDPDNIDPSYWNQVLASHGLSMDRAKRSRIQIGPRENRQQIERVTCIGSSNNLVGLEEEQERSRIRGGKRVHPSGHSPD